MILDPIYVEGERDISVDVTRECSQDDAAEARGEYAVTVAVG